MTGRRLHRVRHGPVVVDPERDSRDWVLAAEAAPLILALSDGLSGRGLRRVLASPQGKAVATARILAEALALPVEVRDGLEEHHRLKAQQGASEAAFRADMARLFARPEEVVFGSKSAAAALARFRGALSGIMAESDADELVVSHGTVISLLAAAGGNGRAEDIWASLRLPDHLVLAWPSLALESRRS
ncbi:MAG: histidine phosphatase family protein [Kiloniellales bacterium]|nr:histidine phosphatase family protein [Kiloniellales bacterium]